VYRKVVGCYPNIPVITKHAKRFNILVNNQELSYQIFCLLKIGRKHRDTKSFKIPEEANLVHGNSN
jgi:hypothetical protein